MTVVVVALNEFCVRMYVCVHEHECALYPLFLFLHFEARA